MTTNEMACLLNVRSEAVEALDIVRYETANDCRFRWSSRNCTGTVQFMYFSAASDRRIGVCEKCAARAARSYVPSETRDDRGN